MWVTSHEPPCAVLGVLGHLAEERRMEYDGGRVVVVVVVVVVR